MALTGVAGVEGEGDENAMAEHEEHPSANDQPEKRSEASRTPDEASRRAFIRKTAEGAALSLFGVMGLDAVVEKVVQRLEEIPASRSLARATGELLHEAGIGAMAFAADGCNCPGMPGGPDFTCQNPAAKFTCTAQNHFRCTEADSFQCNPMHFLCSIYQMGGPAFECASPAAFECSGDQDRNHFWCQPGYLCPGVGQFADTPCGPQTPWDCAPANRFAATCPGGTVQCEGAERFSCPGNTIFRCGDPAQGGSGGFVCPQSKFVCNGGQIVDFQCPVTFDCQQGFKCEANHIFICGGSSEAADFSCGSGNGFTCAAGGNQCNEPNTGAYGNPDDDFDYRPGDFACYAGSTEGADFTCTPQNTFTCPALDDFTCHGAETGGRNFTCNADKFLCQPRVAGYFNCDLDFGGGFLCVAQEQATFQCVAPQHRYDANWPPE